MPRRHNLIYELFVLLVVVAEPQLAVWTFSTCTSFFVFKTFFWSSLGVDMFLARAGQKERGAESEFAVGDQRIVVVGCAVEARIRWLPHFKQVNKLMRKSRILPFVLPFDDLWTIRYTSSLRLLLNKIYLFNDSRLDLNRTFVNFRNWVRHYRES